MTARLISLLEQSPWVEYAEPNYLLTTSAIPSDTSFGTLWGLHNTGQSGGLFDADIDALEAWENFTTGSSDVVVFVIDTGVDYNHPDLVNNIWTNQIESLGTAGVDDDNNGYVDDVHGWNAIANNGDPMDDNNHGTHVAGTIGAVGNNGVGVVGVNWNVSIGAAKFLGANGSGSTTDAIECFNYINSLKTAGVNVVVTNNSWSGGGFSQALMDAMNGPANKILHATAAGNANNNNDATPTYPASYNLDNIISVAATDRNDLYASFSSYGATTVDLAAPGVSILSTIPKGTAADYTNAYASFNGTSMATPHVAGAAALVAAAYPGRTAVQIKQDLMFGTDAISGVGSNSSKPTLTNGRLNVYQTLTDLGDIDDVEAPAAVTELTVAGTGLTSVTLTWKATADDGNIFDSGAARVYDVRYSTLAINSDSAWAAATQAVGEPRPQTVGSTEIFRVTGLQPNTTYHFAVKARDNRGNESALSSPPTTATTRTGTKTLTDGFEGLLTDKWVVQSPWGKSTTRHSGSSATDSPSGNYSNNANTSLTSKTISLAGVKEATVSYWHRYSLESGFDFGHFEVSGDNGATWTTLASYTGANTTFHKVTHNLSAYDGNPTVKIRYRLQSDFSFKQDGWYVDDVEVVGIGTSPADGQSGLSIDDVPIINEEAGSTVASFTVARTGPTDQAVTVHYATANGVTNPANAGPDYVNQSGILTIAAGQTSGIISMAVNADELDEANETFFVNLYDASSNALVTDSQAVGTILDAVDDTPPILESISDSIVTEGDSGTVTAIFTLTLSAPSGQPVSVTFATADGTATAGSDYVARTTSTLTFCAGQTSRAIGVSVNGDLVQESEETFFLNLTNPNPDKLASITDAQGIGTIENDNDPATPPVKLYLTLETGGTVGGVTFADEDILALNVAGGFAMYFDGSDVGLPSSAHIDAFARLSDTQIVMSFADPVTVPNNVGSVDDSDLVLFTATNASTLGANTDGAFSWYFDGSDVGLTSNDEDIDAVEWLSDGSLLISTVGNFSGSSTSGGSLSGDDKDLARFVLTSSGVTTAGTWSIYFDASDVGLTTNNEGVDAVAVEDSSPTDKVILSTTGSFSVTGLSGGDEDVFKFMPTPTSTGSNTAGTYESALLFDGSAFGLEGNDVTGIDLPSVESGGTASAAALVLDGGLSAPASETPPKRTAALMAREQMFSSYGTPQNDLLAILPGRTSKSSSTSDAFSHTAKSEPELSAIELALEDVFGAAV